MPLPKPRPALVQAPAWAGVGLRFRPRQADPSWPADWWQRDLDDPLEFDDTCAGHPLTEREMHVPEAPDG